MHDLRLAIRQLRKNPGFTAVAALTLAMGIGANTAVFSVARTVLFHPIGFAAPDRLMWIRLTNTETGLLQDSLSWREMEDIRQSTRCFAAVATFGSPGAIWEHDDGAEELTALRVTPNLAEVLGIHPVLGRMFDPADTALTAERVVMISHELWQSRFHGDESILGQSLRLDQKVRTIVGVLPPGLRFPYLRSPDLGTGSNVRNGVQSFWFPLEEIQGADREERDHRMFLPVARLKPGIPEEAVRAELAALGQRLAEDYPETNRSWTFDVVSFRDLVLGRTRQAIPILAAAVGAVLLICCFNLANLLLARGVARQQELAVRLALGAGRRRLLGTLLRESLLLSLLGGALGLVFAKGALSAVRALAPAHIPFVREVGLDGTALTFTAGLSLVTALVFGLLPAVQLRGIDAADALRTGARTTGGPRIRAWQCGLLVGQLAVVLALLASAGMLLESFRRLINQDLGYQPGSVIAVDLSTWGMETNEEVCQLYRALQARVSALPGVEAVGTVSSAPLTGKWTIEEKAQVVGRPVPKSERPLLAAGFVAFDYFQAMGIPLLEGRLFHDAELNDSGYGQNVILNQSAASLLFPDGSAVGGRFTVGSNEDRVLEVIGVVKDTREVRLEDRPQPRFYWQYAFGGAQLVVRSSIPARDLIPLMRETIRQSDSRVLSLEFRTMGEIIGQLVAERRFLMAMLATYALTALLVASAGIFGVAAYQLARRRNEFGIRHALGASPAALHRLALLHTGRLGFYGMAIGLFLSLGACRLLANQLFGVMPHDPILLGAVSLLLLGVVLLAGYFPARRAAKIHPMEALRNE